MKSLHYRAINGLGFKSTTFSSHEKQKGFDKIVCSLNYLRGQMSWKNWLDIYSLDLHTSEYKPLVNSQKSWASKENCQIYFTSNKVKQNPYL